MPEPNPRLRVVGEGEPPPRRGRGPGLAVILVGLYAFAFAAALWFLWSVSRRGQGPASPRAPLAARERLPDRGALLAGEGLAPEARAEFLKELSHDCCDCGCDLTLRDCLAGEEKCSRSPDLAEQRRRKLD
jgi:hypothetical protein